jgi:uncharacterized protein (TIGR03000 family)
MLQDATTFCRALLLAGAVGVLTAGTTDAAPAGAFHSGGIHSGGIFNGGFHSGGLNNSFHSGLHLGLHPALRDGLFRGPQLRSYRTYVYPYPLYPNTPSYLSGFGYPYYYGSGYRFLRSSDDSLDQPPEPDESPRLSGLVRPAPGKNAHVTVYVRPDAELWFDKKKAKATGSVREFVTPDLAPGRQYTYEVRAVWRDKGREVTQTRQAVVTAGADVEVDFDAPAVTPKPKPR